MATQAETYLDTDQHALVPDHLPDHSRIIIFEDGSYISREDCEGGGWTFDDARHSDDEGAQALGNMILNLQED